MAESIYLSGNHHGAGKNMAGAVSNSASFAATRWVWSCKVYVLVTAASTPRR